VNYNRLHKSLNWAEVLSVKYTRKGAQVKIPNGSCDAEPSSGTDIQVWLRSHIANWEKMGRTVWRSLEEI